MNLEELLKAQGLGDNQVKSILEAMKKEKIYTTNFENIEERHNKYCRCTYLPAINEDEALKDYDKAKEDINDEFNRRNDLDNRLNNKNRKISIPKFTLKHSNEGDFTNPRNSKKVKPGEIRIKNGGYGETNIRFLKEKEIYFNIVKEYPNGVRCCNVTNHRKKAKRKDINL